MWHIPPEIHLNGGDLAPIYNQQFGISNSTSVGYVCFVGYKHSISSFISSFANVAKFNALHGVAVRPADCKICVSVQGVIEWACKAKVWDYQTFNNFTIFGDKSLEDCLCSLNVAIRVDVSTHLMPHSNCDLAMPLHSFSSSA
jgi:hypothetical protein